ncbi:unnamed protein product (macronuclear) [Paramecium tetraurelia]|uniref:Transmembrane protein n=1 Tax=Paramecium tetraurelia TaxID=5888 RepID=A0CNV0_PARTE|nr:uncharacterized protein GSPATT00008909001 [Paramecium tetraurelia]CAK72467.1 unnamed protein product [Paramecium tetraurelia]|eukprot:XP_001439864.1 hypothetical protein (macronuclear) [Paramecium tetraurelia strain d4-2]
MILFHSYFQTAIILYEVFIKTDFVIFIPHFFNKKFATLLLHQTFRTSQLFHFLIFSFKPISLPTTVFHFFQLLSVFHLSIDIILVFNSPLIIRIQLQYLYSILKFIEIISQSKLLGDLINRVLLFTTFLPQNKSKIEFLGYYYLYKTFCSSNCFLISLISQQPYFVSYQSLINFQVSLNLLIFSKILYFSFSRTYTPSFKIYQSTTIFSSTTLYYSMSHNQNRFKSSLNIASTHQSIYGYYCIRNI